MTGAVLRRAQALFLFKESGEIQRVFIADRPGNDGYGKIRPQEKVTGFPDAQVQKVFLEGKAGGAFENPVQIRTIQSQIIGDGLNGDVLPIAGFQASERLFYVDCLFFLRADLFFWKFTNQEKQIFIQDAVHDQIPVCRKLVGLEHFFMAEPDPVVVAIVEDRGRQKGGPVQIFADFDALKTDPGIGPGVLFVSFIVDELIRADEECIAFAQTPGAAAGLIVSDAA